MRRRGQAAKSGPTLARRVLRLLAALGVTVGDVFPGTVVLSRRKDLRIRQVPDGVVVSRAGRVQVEPLGSQAALVVTSRGPGLRDRTAEKHLYAHLLTQHLTHVFDLYGVNCVIDVGANRGQFGQGLRRAGYTGRIVSFEPVPEVAARLRKAAERDGDWVVHQIALGREDGSTELNVVPGTMSSPLPATAFGARRYAQLREPVVHRVPIRRLDGMLSSVLAGIEDPRPFLKLDTQGFDLEVFAGLGERVADVVAMQSEVALVTIYEGMPRLPQALEAYEGAGFEVTGFYPVSRERATARVLEFDCVLVRPGARAAP